MGRLLILLVIASLQRVAAFPPNRIYFNVDNEFFKIVWCFGPSNVVYIVIITPNHFPGIDATGNIPWDVCSDESVLRLKTTDENFKAFAEKYKLNVKKWKSIPYNHHNNTFTILYHGHQIILSVFPLPVPPMV
ncbi:hypothetical protein FOZ62_007208 [Perkinsus olseni]|uniref:Uncharacterized protein n=1 Tax=Perkinsus olseni TaxID=32597 RepID=A0A7J6TDB2_PEROL|nr:hypothetical protein FOZ62_007208 [Perkinsus olseni]